MSFLTAEYDYDMDIKVQREEAYSEGLEEGRAEGLEEGKAEGIELNHYLMDAGRIDDLKKVIRR